MKNEIEEIINIHIEMVNNIPISVTSKEELTKALTQYVEQQVVKARTNNMKEAMGMLSNVKYWETCPDDYRERIKELESS